MSKDKRAIKIGLNTNGVLRTASSKGHHLSIERKFDFTSGDIDCGTDCKELEGIGFLPDIWANNILDVFINLWNLTGDYELKIDLGQLGNVEYSNYSKYSSMF